jgi:hypothetical protein
MTSSTFRSEVVSIVGGGWSVSEIDLSKIPGTIIAINDAAMHLPRCHAIVSMDRLWTEHRWDTLRDLRVTTWLRRSAVQNIKDRAQPWLRVFECDHESIEFSTDPNRLNGTNSGTCGLNLAYLSRPRDLFLFGFDMQKGPKGEPYWYPPYEWRPIGATSSGTYARWSKEFERVAQQFRAIGTRVTNVSSRSLIGAFPCTTPQLLDMQRAA